MMRHSEAIASVCQICKQEDFYADMHRLVFEVILALKSNGSPVEPRSVYEQLKTSRLLERLGDTQGAAALALSELWDAAALPATVHYYANIVREYAARRELIWTAHALAATAAGNAPIEELRQRREAVMSVDLRAPSAQANPLSAAGAKEDPFDAAQWRADIEEHAQKERHRRRRRQLKRLLFKLGSAKDAFPELWEDLLA
jgi:replicative DNA helicase